MAKTVKEWLEKDVSKVKDRSVKWLSEMYFHREESRPHRQNFEFFMAPADGIILSSTIVGPDEPILEVKGVNYTLKDLMGDKKISYSAVVVEIFMTFYSIHQNRIPYSGIFSSYHLPPLKSYNLPMLSIEKEILSELKLDFDSADYLFNNQRQISSIFSNRLGQNYYIVRIADQDVNCIVDYIFQNDIVKQGQQFGEIRYGSQTSLVIPILNDKFIFEPIYAPMTVVEAGEPLVSIKKIKR